MSVQKFNPRILGEVIPFTQVNTKVIQQIKNIEAGFVWIYLLTLPPDWQVVKVHLMNHFGIGELKIKKIFSYLNEHNLIEYVRERLPNGQLGRTDVRILNGNRFKSTTGAENHPVVNHTYGFSGTTKEINNKEINNKENISCSSKNDEPNIEPSRLDQSLSDKNFEQFWNLYPRKQKKQEAAKIWKREKMAAVFLLIIANVGSRMKGEWKDKPKEFIPLPSSYLNGKRWEDEIIHCSTPKFAQAARSQSGNRVVAGTFKNEPKCTVPDYGPGHPTWEENQKWERSRQGRV